MWRQMLLRPLKVQMGPALFRLELKIELCMNCSQNQTRTHISLVLNYTFSLKFSEFKGFLLGFVCWN